MAELYLTGNSSDGKRLMIAPITSKKLERCSEPPDDTSGYFLMEEQADAPNGALKILARVSDSDAAFRLGMLFRMS